MRTAPHSQKHKIICIHIINLVVINIMNMKLLCCWLGTTDLQAAAGKSEVGLGPVAQAIVTRDYDEVILLSNWDEGAGEYYAKWLGQLDPLRIDVRRVSLTGPTEFGEIYQQATEAITAKLSEHGKGALLTFHLSPGTPAMAAVWILLAKTKFPAELIESSRDHGVRTTSIPFDIAADFIPELFTGPDATLQRLAAGLDPAAPEFADIIHRSEEMQRVVLRARRVAPRSIPVLVEGESGTGKELFARAIHGASPRHDKPFVAINCGAIPAELVESELFGHEKGAFTGADKQRRGHFETADQGTIFLDEIGELPKNMQVKLLRTLQEGEVQPIGSSMPRRVDVRIIAATNRNLLKETASGAFREDLFYRLAVGVLKIPPLRERTGDISLLIDHFLGKINRESQSEPGYEHKQISASARNLMHAHPWPGNIRELQNTLTRAAIWAVGEEISADDIREALLPPPETDKNEVKILNRPLDNGIDLPEIIKTVAVHYLERGLVANNGIKTKTAEQLGLSSYQTLTNWLRKYGVE